MKKVLLLTALACTVGMSLQAQSALPASYSTTVTLTEVTNPSVFSIKEPALHSNARIKTEEHWRKLRYNGILLTSLGAACVTVGAVLIDADIRDYDGKANGDRGIYGVAGIGGGLLAIGGGVTMWAIGNNRLRKLNRFSLNANGKNMGFVYKF